MAGKRFDEEQIQRALSRLRQGGRVCEVCRDLGISAPTLYRWRRRYGGPPVERLRRMRTLEKRVRRLRASVSHLRLERELLQDVLHAEGPPPGQRRAIVESLLSDRPLSERLVCRALGWPRSSIRYRSAGRNDEVLRKRLREIALQDPRSGYRTLCRRLRSEGWAVNHKRVYRLYREEGLIRRARCPPAKEG